MSSKSGGTNKELSSSGTLSRPTTPSPMPAAEGLPTRPASPGLVGVVPRTPTPVQSTTSSTEIPKPNIIQSPVPLVSTAQPVFMTPARPGSSGAPVSTPSSQSSSTSSSTNSELTTSQEAPVLKSTIITPVKPIAPYFESPRFTAAQYLAGAPSYLQQQIYQQDELAGL